MNYIDLFTRTVKNNIRRTAIADRDGKRRTTYAQLDSLSSRAAEKLTEAGCRKGDFVIINMSRSMEYIAAVSRLILTTLRWLMKSENTSLKIKYPKTLFSSELSAIHSLNSTERNTACSQRPVTAALTAGSQIHTVCL